MLYKNLHGKVFLTRFPHQFSGYRHAVRSRPGHSIVSTRTRPCSLFLRHTDPHAAVSPCPGNPDDKRNANIPARKGNIRRQGNGERGTGNGERGTGNGERETGNGKRETGNGERETEKQDPATDTNPDGRTRAHTPTHGAANKARIQILSVQSAISNHHAAISKHQAAGNRQQTTTHKEHAGRRKKRTIGIPQASLNGGDTLNGEKKNGRLAESRPFE